MKGEGKRMRDERRGNKKKGIGDERKNKGRGAERGGDKSNLGMYHIEVFLTQNQNVHCTLRHSRFL